MCLLNWLLNFGNFTCLLILYRIESISIKLVEGIVMRLIGSSSLPLLILIVLCIKDLYNFKSYKRYKICEHYYVLMYSMTLLYISNSPPELISSVFVAWFIYSLFSRIEYDAYRTDLEELNLGPRDANTLPKIEQSQHLFQAHKEKYDKMRNDVSIKLKLLEENKVNSFFTVWDLSVDFKIKPP